MPEPKPPDRHRRRLEGVTFAFAGTQLRAIRDAMKFVASEGATVLDDVTPDVRYLVVPEFRETPSTEQKQAKRLNRKGASIQEITPGEIVKTLNLSRKDVLAMLKGDKQSLKRLDTLLSVCDRLRGEEFEIDFSVDLTGASLRAASLRSANLTRLVLDKADLREADLRASELPPLKDARLDEADLERSRLPEIVNCSLKKTRLARARLGRPMGHDRFERSTFDQADMTGVTAGHLAVSDCSFSRAVLKKARLVFFDARGCDFSGALFDDSSLEKADLSDADLHGASLRRAHLPKIRLRGADLTGADFRGAYLVGADLTGSNVDGADFRRANLYGACVDGVDVTTAEGLAGVPRPTGALGPNLKRLDQLLDTATEVKSSIKLRLSEKQVVDLVLAANPKGKTSAASVMADNRKPPPIGTQNYFSDAGASEALLELAADVGWGKLDHATATASGKDCPIEAEALQRLLLAAWCEAFGEHPPGVEDVSQANLRREQRVKELHDELLENLRQRGPAVEDADSRREAARLNEAIRVLLDELGYFERDIDLTGVNLAGANLTGLNLHKVNLEGATLNEADARCSLGHANLKGADLKGAKLSNVAHADLTGANLQRARLDGAVLLGAKLDGAVLKSANLCGADLRHAVLDGVDWQDALFDGKTRFPVGFTIPKELTWAGKGPDPRAGQTRKAKAQKTGRGKKPAKPKRPSRALSAAGLLSDARLAKIAAGVQHDPALPGGVSVELIGHPVYGHDFAFSLCLEYCQHRFELTEEELSLNLWYRCERFARLYDAVEGGCDDGNHQRADDVRDYSVLPNVSREAFQEIDERIDREVRKILAR